MTMNPYHDREDFCFWSRAMTWPAPGQIDPVTRASHIAPAHKVSTLGSCFAQHLGRHLQKFGNYYVVETAPGDMGAEEAKNRNYGVFSARYGNIYTVRQAVQLFDRAFGAFAPRDDVWAHGERFVDAFRPQIEPDGFESPEQVRRAAQEHFEYVRRVFLESDWLVFTLGLTEGWRSRRDGAVYPTAPGVAGGSFDPDAYEFVNFSAEESREDLYDFIQRVRRVNPAMRFLLTVSPVPLIATYESRHVWVSTTFSKAALRVAADAAERNFSDVIYFPSYEVITSPASGGRYYADDLRQVRDVGVKHVMKLFARHFLDSQGGARTLAAAPPLAIPQEADIVCDEEVIEAALRQSGAL